ncbi:hypothetical protein [Corynebacterium renale]|uniref:hypothetical protein n=1 Tax=Corynebacterium renale TaxID=1724 RepID=UPI00069EB914|nr:hypothetical protein [Corynebacterium renale]SQI19803.1 permease [Corynebacterium renale]
MVNGLLDGSGLAALFGCAIAATELVRRSISIICAIVSVLSILLMCQIPEDAFNAGSDSKLDWPGIITLALSVVSR